jgi:P-type Ca2+ transporter type 2C
MVATEKPAEVMAEATKVSWHMMTGDAVVGAVASGAHGLSHAEAARRRSAEGPNLLEVATGVQWWRILLRQFKSLLIWVLVAAAVLSAVLGEWIDCLAVLTIILLNALIGFYQEFSAEKSIAALRHLTAPQARVWRDGKLTQVPAADVVRGDVLELEAGDIVAADARLLQATSLRCSESILTGESEPVSKHIGVIAESDAPIGDRANMVFMGTIVVAGMGQAVITAIGMKSEIGRIATLLGETSETATPLQKKLNAFGKVLVLAALGIVLLLVVLGLVRGESPLALFMTAVSLAVAAVPEGLPAVVTIALALGVMRMARRRALVRTLPSVETLGSTTVICTDKTGTLTVGEMTAREIFVANKTFHVTGEGYGTDGEILFEGQTRRPEHAVQLLELATVLAGSNNAHLTIEDGHWRLVGDPTEGALLAAAHKAGARREALERELPKHHEVPFDSDRKRRTVVRLMPNERLRAFVNGAPDLLLNHCTHIYTATGVKLLTHSERERIASVVAAMAERGLRVLGSAYRDLSGRSAQHLSPHEIEKDLVFVGCVGMQDPPRAEAKEAVAHCRRAGIHVVMITGDHPRTALAIARELGIADGKNLVLSGAELDKLSDDDLRSRAPRIAVYARVTAEHKLRIVRAWKANNAVVAMTGDGVNDAPAIKGADIGVAMGRTGTEVTKQAADLIITDDNFASIVAAVEEGRGIYDNIRKTLQYLLASNTGELLLVTSSVAVGLPLPLLPVHLLWINLVTDGPPALCLAAEPIDADVLRRAPRPVSAPLADRAFLSRILLAGVLAAAMAFGVFAYFIKTTTPEEARTAAFTFLVFAQLLLSLGFRSEKLSLWKLPLLRNWKLLAVIAVSIGFQIVATQNAAVGGWLKIAALSFPALFVLLMLAGIPLLGLEIAKLWRGRTEPYAGSEPGQVL